MWLSNLTDATSRLSGKRLLQTVVVLDEHFGPRSASRNAPNIERLAKDCTCMFVARR